MESFCKINAQIVLVFDSENPTKEKGSQTYQRRQANLRQVNDSIVSLSHKKDLKEKNNLEEVIALNKCPPLVAKLVRIPL